MNCDAVEAERYSLPALPHGQSAAVACQQGFVPSQIGRVVCHDGKFVVAVAATASGSSDGSLAPAESEPWCIEAPPSALHSLWTATTELIRRAVAELLEWTRACCFEERGRMRACV